MKKSLKTLIAVFIILLFILQLSTTVIAVGNSSATTENVNVSDWVKILIVLLSIGFIVCFIKCFKYKRTIKMMGWDQVDEIDRLSKSYEAQIRDWEKKLSTERDCNAKAKETISNLKVELSEVQDRYRRANILYPDADKAVSDMIQQEVESENIRRAKDVEEAIKAVSRMSPSKERVSTFKEVIDKYLALTEVQKGYVGLDIRRVKELLSRSEQIKQQYMISRYKEEASRAMQSIASKIKGISKGTASNLNVLEQAMEVYWNMKYNAKKYSDRDLIKKLETLLEQAKADKERIKAENEGRRRRDRMKSTINMHSSYGGHV